ncbi:MAG: Yae1 family protein [Thermoactinospora sp.]|nr:Yae1 family protein [Thermoactinospora sp.]
MPTPSHDAANSLIREHPELAVRFLRTVGHVTLPDVPVQAADGELNDRVSTSCYADTVLVGGPIHDRRFSLISEIETRITQGKLDQTIRYAATLWLHYGKPIHIVFFTPDPNYKKFDHEVTVVSGCLTLSVEICFVGPDEIPAITDPAVMENDPALFVLSVIAHGDRPDVAEAFCRGMAHLPHDYAAYYYEHAAAKATRTIRQRMEATMKLQIPAYSDMAKEHRGIGRTEGKAEGIEEGKAEGRVEGRVEGKVGALLITLEARGLTVSSEQRARIEDCTDLSQLDQWIRRALTGATTAEILATTVQ